MSATARRLNHNMSQQLSLLTRFDDIVEIAGFSLLVYLASFESFLPSVWILKTDASVRIARTRSKYTVTVHDQQAVVHISNNPTQLQGHVYISIVRIEAHSGPALVRCLLRPHAYFASKGEYDLFSPKPNPAELQRKSRELSGSSEERCWRKWVSRADEARGQLSEGAGL